jgi:hypothetical protein
MATESEARRARDLHQDELASSGAHSLSVEPQKEAQGSFVVVAWIQHADKAAASLPSSLTIEESGRRIAVPLVVRESKPFQLE